MRAVVTGAQGYIGRALVRFLNSEGVDVVGVDRNTSKEELAQIFSKKVDSVFHLAGKLYPEVSSQDIQMTLNDNLSYSIEILDLSARSSVPIFVSAGSYWQDFDSELSAAKNFYGACKSAFETFERYYASCYNMRIANLKLTDVYGPRDPRNKIINLMVKAALKKEILDLSPGEQELSFLYIDDVCRAFLHCANLLLKLSSATFYAYSVSSVKNMNLKDIGLIVSAMTGSHDVFNFGGRRYEERQIYNFMPISSSLPGWEPTVSIEEGISQIIKECGSCEIE